MEKKPALIRKLFPARRLFSFFICLLIATFLWLINVLNRTYTRTLAIPVKFVHYPLNKHVNNHLPNYIMVDVKASGAKLMMLLLKKSLDEITIDVSDVIQSRKKPDRASISTLNTIGNLSKLLNTDVELIKVKPDSIHFVFGKISSKRVYIKPHVQVNYESAAGIFSKIKVEPAYVLVSSDSATLARIDTFYTEKIVLNDLNKNVEQSAELEVPEELDDMLVLSQNKVQLRINLDEFIQKKIQVPVEVVNCTVNMAVKTFPAFAIVTVNAPYNLYDSLDASSLRVTADFSAPERSTGKLKLKATAKNPDVKIISCVPEKVEYILRKK